MAHHLVGIDVGGTFTDFVAYDPDSGAIDVWKNLSTPADPTDGIITGLERLNDRLPDAYVRLGTTVATNTILERKGATVAYLATQGFRDVPFIQRGNRKSHYDITWIKPDPLVKHRHCFDVEERIDRDGHVVQPLNEEAVRALARTLAGEVDAVAVTLLFSFIEPAHERRIAEVLSEVLPDVEVSISFNVLPRWKEYERASTTIADAYLKPVMSRYLMRMRDRLELAGARGHVAVIKSNGGEMTLDAAAAAPIHMTVSGPSGGVIGAKFLARELGIDHCVTLDMGGTSTDCSTIVDGEESFTTNFEIEWGLPIQIPMIDIRTIGAGGGSIAWIDKGGLLRVGPHSAGADPGPACYAGDGDEATVTDANVVLGRINPKNFLGGAMTLDEAAAEAAVAKIAEHIGQSVTDTAQAIVRIANNNMVGALRAVLTERGLDPRDFTLLGFGGAGPLHTCDLMHDAGIPRGLVPNHPGQFSAYGFIMTDARVDRHRTVQMTSQNFDMDRASDVLRELTANTLEDLERQGYRHGIMIQRAVEMRYFGQNYELEVPIGFDAFDAATCQATWQAFHEMHRARFGFNMTASVIEVVNFIMTAVSTTAKPALSELPRAVGEAKPRTHSDVVYEAGALETPVFERADLLRGHEIAGPAVVEEAASVTVVRPGQKLAVDRFGNLLING